MEASVPTRLFATVFRVYSTLCMELSFPNNNDSFNLPSIHVSSFGSGSHCPLVLHVANVFPKSINPDKQWKLTVAPSSTGGPLYPVTFSAESVEGSGSPQLAVQTVKSGFVAIMNDKTGTHASHHNGE